MDATIPWPAALGAVGGCLTMLVATIAWLLRQLATEQLLTRRQHESTMALSVKRGDEWKESTLLERSVSAELRDMLDKSLEANKINDHFYRTYLPKPPNSGDNGAMAAGSGGTG